MIFLSLSRVNTACTTSAVFLANTNHNTNGYRGFLSSVIGNGTNG